MYGEQYGKVLTFPLESYEDGKEVVNSLVIKLVSQYAFDEFAIVQKDLNKVLETTNKVEERKLYYEGILSKVAEMEFADVKRIIAEQNAEAAQIAQSWESLDMAAMFKRRVELCQYLLKRNGITDEKYFDFKFWYECVHPQSIMEFLQACFSKDKEDEKKKGERVDR